MVDFCNAAAVNTGDITICERPKYSIRTFKEEITEDTTEVDLIKINPQNLMMKKNQKLKKQEKKRKKKMKMKLLII